MLPTLVYSPSLFVNREEEVIRVESKAKDLASGRPIHNRVVHFPGFAGFGKSWLLRHLYRRLSKDPETRTRNLVVLPLWLNKWMRHCTCLPPYETITCGLLQSLLKRIMRAQGTPSLLARAKGVTLMEVSQWVEDMVGQAHGQQAFVLLVDALDEVPPAWLQVLEERLFEPLVLRQSNVLIVMAGRNLHYNWTTLALRPPPDEQPIRLKPLNQENTREQLQCLESQFPGAEMFAEQIYALTDGAPGGNVLIASQLGQPPQMPNETQALMQHNAKLLQDVPPDLRWCFYALCVPRGFHTEWMENLLPVADPGGRTWDFPACQSLIPQLTATRLVRAYRKDGEYRYWLDEYLGPRLELELQERDPDLWRRLHCTLICMYRAWVENPDFASTAPRWQGEAAYHARRLQDAGYDPDQCLPDEPRGEIQ